MKIEWRVPGHVQNESAVPLAPALLAASPILFADAAQAQSRCPPGQDYCRPGAWGPGGCYSVLRMNTCRNGLICTDSMIHCPPGPKGPGGCYRVGIRQCDRGLIR